MCRRMAIRHQLCNHIKIHQKKCATAEHKTAMAGRSIWCEGAMRNLDEFTRCSRCRRRTEDMREAQEMKRELRDKFGIRDRNSRCFCM
ncbi:hypothetical protein ACLOAV_000582 [Pseudogymnoascus australis]